MKALVEKVVGDVKVLASDTKELVKATAAKSGERLAQARARVESAGGVMREKPAARAADRYVQQHPWKAVGISAAIAFLVGLLIG